MLTPNLHASRKMKRTPIGEIPVEWGFMRFGEIVKSSQYGVSLESAPIGQTRILRMNNINGGKVNLSDLAYVSGEREELKASLLTEGDLLFNRTNSLELVGKTAVFNETGIFTFASYIVRFRLNELKADPYFVNYFFNMPASRQRLRLLAAVGVSQCNINPTILQKYFLVPLPPPSEQRKITEILDTWDRALERLEKLIAAKKQFKHCLLQQLLTGKKRVEGFKNQSWRTCTLGDVASELNLRNNGQLSRDVLLAVTKAEGMVPMREKVQGEGVERCKIVRKGWFAYNPMRLNIGSIAKWDGPQEAMVSGDYVVFRCHEDKLDPTYLDHYRRSYRWRRFVETAGIGSVRVRIWFTDLGRMKLRLPSIEEQCRIVEVLDSCENEISILAMQLQMLQLQKKGLMEKLLTGKVRVTHLLTEST